MTKHGEGEEVNIWEDGAKGRKQEKETITKQSKKGLLKRECLRIYHTPSLFLLGVTSGVAIANITNNFTFKR